jgi:hypothetical protein
MVTKESIDMQDSSSRADAFDAYVPGLLTEGRQKLGLEIIGGCEVGVSPLRGMCFVTVSIPGEVCLSQAGPGRDNRDRTTRIPLSRMEGE